MKQKTQKTFKSEKEVREHLDKKYPYRYPRNQPAGSTRHSYRITDKNYKGPKVPSTTLPALSSMKVGETVIVAAKETVAFGVIRAKGSGKYLLGRRSDKVSNPGKWAFFGGHLEEGETLLEALMRELGEEMGGLKEYKITDQKVIRKEYKDYYYFYISVENEFVPELNEEHNAWAWTNLENLPTPLHPMVKKLKLK